MHAKLKKQTLLPTASFSQATFFVPSLDSLILQLNCLTCWPFPCGWLLVVWVHWIPRHLQRDKTSWVRTLVTVKHGWDPTMANDFIQKNRG